MTVGRVHLAGGLNLHDAAGLDFFQQVEFIVDDGVGLAGDDLLQGLQGVGRRHGNDFRVEFLEEVMPGIVVHHRHFFALEVGDADLVQTAAAASHDDARHIDVGRGEQHVFAAAARLGRGHEEVDVSLTGLRFRAGPVRQPAHPEVKAGQLAKQAQIIPAQAGIAAPFVKHFQRVEVGIHPHDDHRVIREPGQFRRGKLVQHRFFLLHQRVQHVGFIGKGVGKERPGPQNDLKGDDAQAQTQSEQQTHMALRFASLCARAPAGNRPAEGMSRQNMVTPWGGWLLPGHGLGPG